MVCVQSSVHIEADPDAVFALVTDVARKARLAPHTRVLAVVQETEGPVRIGTVFHYRLVIEGRIADYRSRCTDFQPGRMMETESDSCPPFKVRVTVDPVPGGARLTQQETFALPPVHVPLPGARGWLGTALRILLGTSSAIVQDGEAVAREEADMKARLQPRLDRWLASIKDHLERQRDRTEA